MITASSNIFYSKTAVSKVIEAFQRYSIINPKIGEIVAIQEGSGKCTLFNKDNEELEWSSREPIELEFYVVTIYRGKEFKRRVLSNS